MKTAIGGLLKSNKRAWWFSFLIAVVAIISDIALVVARPATDVWFDLPAAAVVVFLGALAFFYRDRNSFGLCFLPLQGGVYWVKVTLLLGAIMLAIILAASWVLLGVLKYQVPSDYYYLSHKSQILPLFVSMCIAAPITEEIIFRLALCPPLAAKWKPMTAIIVSGSIFAAMHVLNGNPGPDNMIAGFILAWAFLKSGSLSVPIALHSLGNFFAFLYQIALFSYHN
jgi:uncharacterized protein